MADAVTRRSKRLLKDAIRHAEVVREFEQFQEQGREQDPGEWPAAEHAAYMPPWRDRTTDGRLGPEYGPRTAGQYQRAVDEYQGESYGAIGSPALWDVQEEARCAGGRIEQRMAMHSAKRHDAALMAEWMARNSGQVPDRELDVYCCHWVDGMGATATARRLGLTVDMVKMYIGRLRRRVKRPDTR